MLPSEHWPSLISNRYHFAVFDEYTIDESEYCMLNLKISIQHGPKRKTKKKLSRNIQQYGECA